MINKTHLSEQEVYAIVKPLIDKFEDSLTTISDEIVPILVQNGLCHHNMHDITEVIKLKIAEKVILSLPDEMAHWYTTSMLLEVIAQEKDYSHVKPSGVVIGGIFVRTDLDEDTTGETPEL